MVEDTHTSRPPSPDLGQRRAGCGCCVILDKTSLVQWLVGLARDIRAEADISNRPGQFARMGALADEVLRIESTIEGLCLNPDCGQARGHAGVCD